MFQHTWFPILTLPRADNDEYLQERLLVQRELHRLNELTSGARKYFTSRSEVYPNFANLVAEITQLVSDGEFSEAAALLRKSHKEIKRSVDILEEKAQPFMQ